VTKVKRRMTAAEFEAVRPLLNISADRCEAAKAALVDGKTLASIAEVYGWSRQAVNDAVGIVWNTLERYHESQRATANAGALLPPGWEQVTLIAPSSLIAKFRAEIAATSTETPTEAPTAKPKARRK
jgi:hypothetical protein